LALTTYVVEIVLVIEIFFLASLLTLFFQLDLVGNDDGSAELVMNLLNIWRICNCRAKVLESSGFRIRVSTPNSGLPTPRPMWRRGECHNGLHSGLNPTSYNPLVPCGPPNLQQYINQFEQEVSYFWGTWFFHTVL